MLIAQTGADGTHEVLLEVDRSELALLRACFMRAEREGHAEATHRKPDETRLMLTVRVTGSGDDAEGHLVGTPLDHGLPVVLNDTGRAMLLGEGEDDAD